MKHVSLFLFSSCLLLLYTIPLHAQHWDLKEKLGTSDQNANDNLGISVAVRDTSLIAGAWFNDGETAQTPSVSSSGAAYIYGKQADGSWVERQKLVSPNQESLGYFGFEVAIADNVTMVGAYNEDHSGFGNAGRVYVYQQGGDGHWTLHQTLIAPDPANADYFGYALAMTDDYALIGAYNHNLDENGENDLDDAGAAYLYQRQADQSWTLVQKLVAPDREENDGFGKHLAIAEQGIVIGAFDKNGDNFQVRVGAAYAYHSPTPDLSSIQSTDLQRITPSDQDNFEQFGWGVAISGNWIAVGKSSEADEPNGGITSNIGAAYFFKWDGNTWEEEQKVYASDFSPNAHFGRSVAMDGSACVIGAGSEPEDANGENWRPGAGAAYVYELQADGQWTEAQKLVGTNRSFNDLFGEDAVALDGLQIAVGAWLADTLPGGVLNDAGAVYVFERDSPLTATKQPLSALLPQIELANNPSRGLVRLLNKSSETMPGYLRLFNLAGQPLFQVEVVLNHEWQKDFSPLPAGSYWLQWEGEGGSKVWKWVKI